MLESKIKIIKKEEKEFPYQLRELKDCPEFLFVWGKEEILNDFSIAVIGSRVCSEYGKDMTKDFVRELVRAGVGIVSGMADGIDRIAHEACIKEGGKTIAVLGEGLEICYQKNRKMMEEIVESGGVILSEYFPDQKANLITFPRRNRLISGIARGVLVTEAREKSGAFITTQFAIKQGKKVFAIPTNLTNLCGKGNNIIILEQKAKIVTKVEDLLYEYPQKFENKRKCEPKVRVEQRRIPLEYKEIWDNLSFELVEVNQLCKKMKKPIAYINSMLLMMEMQGWVEQKNGKYFRKNK